MESEQLRAIRGLLPHLWPRQSFELRARVAASLACLLVAKLATVAVPLYYKRAVDALSPHASVLIVAPIALILAYSGLRVAGQAFGELRDALFAKVAQRAVRSIALDTFRHLHSLALRFHLDRQTGGMSRAIERGTAGITFLLSFMLFNVLPTLVELALVSAVLWKLYSFAFAAVTLVTILFYIGFTVTVTEWRTKFRREMNERDTEANAKAIDSLLNYETVKYFNNEEHEARRFDSALALYERAAVRSQTSLSALNIGQGAVIAVGLTAVMIMAGQGVAAGRMTVGDFVLVNSYLVQLYLPLNFLGFVYRQIRQSLADIEQMMRLLRVEREIEDAPGAIVLPPGPGAVEFDHVRFAYDPRRPILEDLGFRVAPGRMVAVVGASGAGKSTLSRLLYRFYDVTGGAIRVDGHDLRDLTQASLRRAIGIVPQDTVLFNDTIRYNILYGRPGASQAEMEEAARLARIHDFVVSLPDGYATRVGERGLKLSGGEKQRVAIARVILKRPRILIFDEATSALDSKTEKEIQASLDSVSAGTTTLVIAHRLSTVVGADQILVLEAGRIVERGAHAELLAREGIYAAMWRRQMEARRGEEAQLPEPAPAQ